MKENYKNTALGVSDKAFTKPANMSINVDCSKVKDEQEEDNDSDDDLEGIDF